MAWCDPKTTRWDQIYHMLRPASPVFKSPLPHHAYGLLTSSHLLLPCALKVRQEEKPQEEDPVMYGHQGL